MKVDLSIAIPLHKRLVDDSKLFSPTLRGVKREEPGHALEPQSHPSDELNTSHTSLQPSPSVFTCTQIAFIASPAFS
jgi:hypothetical protein